MNTSYNNLVILQESNMPDGYVGPPGPDYNDMPSGPPTDGPGADMPDGYVGPPDPDYNDMPSGPPIDGTGADMSDTEGVATEPEFVGCQTIDNMDQCKANGCAWVSGTEFDAEEEILCRSKEEMHGVDMCGIGSEWINPANEGESGYCQTVEDVLSICNVLEDNNKDICRTKLDCALGQVLQGVLDAEGVTSAVINNCDSDDGAISALTFSNCYNSTFESENREEAFKTCVEADTEAVSAQGVASEATEGEDIEDAFAQEVAIAEETLAFNPNDPCGFATADDECQIRFDTFQEYVPILIEEGTLVINDYPNIVNSCGRCITGELSEENSSVMSQSSECEKSVATFADGTAANCSSIMSTIQNMIIQDQIDIESAMMNATMDAAGDTPEEEDTGNACIGDCVSVDYKLMDSYGDGWNGNILKFRHKNTGKEYQLNDETDSLFADQSGSLATGTLEMECGEYTVSCGGGDWQDEISFTIKDKKQEHFVDFACDSGSTGGFLYYDMTLLCKDENPTNPLCGTGTIFDGEKCTVDYENVCSTVCSQGNSSSE